MTKPELARLLNLYPIQTIRTTWVATKGLNKTAAIKRVVSQATEEQIVSFAQENFGLTKQHVYLRSFAPAQVASILANPLGLDGLKLKTTTGTRREFFYLLPLRYRVVVAAPLRYEHLDFPWPVSLAFENGTARIAFTIMEKNLSAYFADSPSVRVDTRSLDEEGVLARLGTEHVDAYEFATLDLNRGIKDLLDRDIIDWRKVKFRKTKSLAVETMDEEYTGKANNPVVHAQVLESPLLKSVFEYRTDDPPVQHFAADASAGLVVFPTFAENADAVAKVIGNILQHN